MDNHFNFQPNSEKEKEFAEYYNNLSAYISNAIRGLDEKERLATLRELTPTDASLMNLYLQAIKNEDYETCATAKTVLEERGYQVPS